MTPEQVEAKLSSEPEMIARRGFPSLLPSKMETGWEHGFYDSGVDYSYRTDKVERNRN